MQNMFQKPNCLSDVDVILSQIHVMFSEINQKMSSCPANVQSQMLLPRVDIILSEIMLFVSLSQDCDDANVNDSLDASMEWDVNDYNNNFYSLCYDVNLTDDASENKETVQSIMTEYEETILFMSEDQETVLSMSKDQETVMTKYDLKEVIKSESTLPLPDVMITAILSTISTVAPNSIFQAKKSKKRRRRKLVKKVHPELRVVWQNFGNIFPSNHCDDDKEGSL